MANTILRIFDLGNSSLLAQQQGIHVTGNNISNVNTKGYSRQRILLETAGDVGSGVQASGALRIHSRFVAKQLNREGYRLGMWEAQRDTLQRAEILLEESAGVGINQSMAEFFNAWQDVASNPTGLTEREVLLSKSRTLATQFQTTHENLQQLRADTDLTANDGLKEINRLADEIAKLNVNILSVETTGQNANALRDQRDLAIQDLSELIDIGTAEGDRGILYVSVGAEGRSLVIGGEVDPLPDQIGALPAEVTVTGGKLKGWMDASDQVEGYLADLEDLSQTLTFEVNQLHRAGTDLNGVSNIDFFDPSSPLLSLSITSYDQVAASLSGAPGDNANAIAIARLQDTTVTMQVSGKQSTMDDFYNSLVNGVGNDVQSAERNYDHQSEVMTQLTNYRESISGVSLDEEMIQLIQYQKAYEAAAKVIVTAQEMLQTIIDMV